MICLDLGSIKTQYEEFKVNEASSLASTLTALGEKINKKQQTIKLNRKKRFKMLTSIKIMNLVISICTIIYTLIIIQLNI